MEIAKALPSYRVVDASLSQNCANLLFSPGSQLTYAWNTCRPSYIFPKRDLKATIMMVSGRAVATALCALGTTSAFTAPLAAGSFRAVSVRVWIRFNFSSPTAGRHRCLHPDHHSSTTFASLMICLYQRLLVHPRLPSPPPTRLPSSLFDRCLSFSVVSGRRRAWLGRPAVMLEETCKWRPW